MYPVPNEEITIAWVVERGEPTSAPPPAPPAAVVEAYVVRTRYHSEASRWMTIVLVAVIAFGVRAVFLNRSYNIFIDEVTYFRVAQSVAQNLQVNLFGRPFLLHPPAFFFLEAAYLKVFRPTGTLIEQIYAARYLNLACAALSAVALFSIARHVAGRAIGFIATTLFIIDPFIVETNSRNMLDTPAVCWVLVGYWIIVGAMGPERVALGRGRIGAAGAFFGLALLTKDMMAFVTLVPLAVLFTLRWSLPRRTTAGIIGVACVTYGLYPLVVAIAGQWGPFVQQKTHGFRRFVGAAQETGFHHQGSPTLLSTILTQLAQFGTTYALIGLGALAVCTLTLLGGPINRLLAVWTASAYILLAYGIAFGALEEQFFYYLVVPALLATTIAARLLARSPRIGRAARRFKHIAVALVVVCVGWGSYRWAYMHLTPGNGYEEALTYIDRHVPPAQRHIASTDVTGQFLLGKECSPPWGLWERVGQLQASDATYVLVNPAQVVWDHGSAGLVVLRWIERHDHRVFYFSGNGMGANGPLALYRLSARRTPGIASAGRRDDGKQGVGVLGGQRLRSRVRNRSGDDY
jgi:4-amino-4-deoxy-L-arabinose transferase-like glycosyltransferase